jgi:hypothetical protein
MENMSISYQDGATPIFFRETGAPVVYRISMSFKEMYLSTQEDV